jgi:hypothetical protein
MTDSIEEDLDLVLDDDWDFEPGEDIGCPHPSVLLRMHVARSCPRLKILLRRPPTPDSFTSEIGVVAGGGADS